MQDHLNDRCCGGYTVPNKLQDLPEEDNSLYQEGFHKNILL